MLKVIFLDIDGVLNFDNCSDRLVDNSWHECSPAAVERLNKIIRATGAKIVLSSTWGNYHSYEWVEGFLVAHGLDMSYDQVMDREKIILGVTPKKLSSMRGQEINFWLQDAEEDGLEVFSYVVLDDDTSAMQLHEGRFIQTRMHYGGLLDEHVEKAIEILNTPV